MTAARLSGGLIVFLAALMLRSAWVHFAGAEYGARLKLPDERLHWELARNLAQDGTLVSDDGLYAARMPGYPLFLALFASWSSAGVLAARAAQAVLGSLTAWLVYALTLRTLGRRAALVAGLLAAADLFAIFFAGLLLTETLFTLIGVAFMYFAARVAGIAQGPECEAQNGAASAQVALTIGTGLCGAAAVMTRPSSLGLVVLVWMLTLMASAEAWWLRLRRVALWVTMLVFALAPWGLRNQSVIGDFAWLSTNGGVTLYDGQGPQATGASDQSFLRGMPELARLSEHERDARLRDLALAEMGHDPQRVVRLAGEKFLRTWSLMPNAAEFRTGSRDVASALFTGVVLLGAAVGTWRLRQRPALLALLWLPIIYFTLVHCVYVGSLRYRVPVMPFVEILAAAAMMPGAVRATTPPMPSTASARP